MPEQIRVSICIIAKNEDSNLKRCLDSILPIIHEPWAELIIVDTGSTDRTVEVAREYTEHVFEKQFIPWNFSEARNYGISKASGHWIMVMDADEQLHQDSLYVLEDLLWNEKYHDNGSIFFSIHNYYEKTYKLFTEFTQPRVFRNTGSPIYSGDVHNRPECPTPYLFATNVIIRHYGYMFQGKKDLFDTKVKRTLPMLLKNHETNPTDLHNLTHLVKQFYVMKQYDEVIEYGDAWMKLMRGAGYNEGWFSFLECFQQIAFAYGQKQDGENILRVIEECERYSHRVVPLYFVAGDFFATQGEQDRAAEYFEKGVKCYQTEGSPYEALLTSNARMMLPEVLHWLAVHYFRNRQYATAGGYLNEAVRINDGRMQMRWDIWNEAVGKKNLVLEPKRSKRKAG